MNLIIIQTILNKNVHINLKLGQQKCTSKIITSNKCEIGLCGMLQKNINQKQQQIQKYWMKTIQLLILKENALIQLLDLKVVLLKFQILLQLSLIILSIENNFILANLEKIFYDIKIKNLCFNIEDILVRKYMKQNFTIYQRAQNQQESYLLAIKYLQSSIILMNLICKKSLIKINLSKKLINSDLFYFILQKEANQQLVIIDLQKQILNKIYLMIKSSMSERLCELHKEKINALCLNLNCNQNRLVCFDCVTSAALHIGHPQQSLTKIEKFEEILNQQNSQCSNLIAQLSKMIDEILITFNRLKNGIDDKYNLSIERTKILSNDQINQYISNIIQYEKQSKEMKMKLENMCYDFLNKLKNLVIEMQLEELNYAQISKENQGKAEKLYKEGYSLYYDKKDFNGAIKLFDESLIYNPKHQLSLWGKGEAIRSMGQKKESIDWFNKALAINPKHIYSLFGKGEAIRLMGQYKESIEWYDKVLAINPQHIYSLVGKGASLNSIGKYEEAYDVLSQALELDPSYSQGLTQMKICKEKLKK